MLTLIIEIPVRFGYPLVRTRQKYIVWCCESMSSVENSSGKIELAQGRPLSRETCRNFEKNVENIEFWWKCWGVVIWFVKTVRISVFQVILFVGRGRFVARRPNHMACRDGKSSVCLKQYSSAAWAKTVGRRSAEKVKIGRENLILEECLWFKSNELPSKQR